MKCQFCNQTIQLGERYIQDWQGQVYHASCFQSGRQCGCCNALIVPFQSAFRVSDDFDLCNHCQQQAVIYSEQFQKCCNSVYKFFEMGGIGFPKHKIEFQLVNYGVMHKNIRGRVTYDSLCSKYTVQILKGLTKAICCGVLAHEMMHIVLIEQNHQFTQQETEGLCELASYFVYKMIGDDISKEWIERMQQNPDPIYGEGYRMMHKRVKQYGSLQEYLKSCDTNNK